jgi:hypothetical protein
MDAETPARVKGYRRLAPEKREDVPPEALWQAWTQGGLSLPP